MTKVKRACGAFLLISVSLAGCASVEKVLPQDGPTMLDIYEGHIAATSDISRPASSYPSDVVVLRNDRRSIWRDIALDAEVIGYTRSVESEIDVLFPELPNPRIVMYVFPHLSTDDRLPVPGYATAFSMYERTEFALPGEFAPTTLQPVERQETSLADKATYRGVHDPISGGQ